MRHAPAGGAGSIPVIQPDSQFDFASLARAVWRRKYWIVLPAMVVAIVAAVVVSTLTPRYRSETRVLIENRESVYNRPEADRNNPSADRVLLDQEAMQSQVQLALSRDLARKIVDDLKLAERPEFNPNVTSGSMLGEVLALVGLTRIPQSASADERVLERFYERLSVFQVEKSRVIAIEFRSEDPDLAARVANAVAEGYLVVQQNAKKDSMRQASLWLGGEIERLRGRVAEAEARVERFRNKANLVLGSNNTPLSAQQLAELNSQVAQARAQKADLESKARSITEMLRVGKLAEASAIINSDLMRRLSEQRSGFRAQLAEQSSTLLDQHPRIKELKAQIAEVEVQMRKEAEKLVRSFESDAKIAGAKLESMQLTLDQVKGQAGALGVQDVELRSLERDAKSQRDLLESYLARYRDATSRESPDAVQADARIVSRAKAASTPYFPKKLPIILIAALATLMCGVALVALNHLLSADYSYANRMEELPAEPAKSEAAVVARAEALRVPLPPAAKYSSNGRIKEHPLGALPEQIRKVGRGIVTVCRPDDRSPSSNVAIELARELGQRGARVVLVDLDTHAGVSADVVANAAAPGLSEILTADATFADAIQRDRASRIHVLPLGRGVIDAAALLSSERLSIILGALSKTYDHVVIAAAPLGPSGAERLARFSRVAVLVVPGNGEAMFEDEAETLVARGFANVMVVAVNTHDDMPRRFAA